MHLKPNTPTLQYSSFFIPVSVRRFLSLHAMTGGYETTFRDSSDWFGDVD